MKKVISVILTSFLMLTILTPLNTVLAWEAGDTDVDLRVGVLSDAHVGYGGDDNKITGRTYDADTSYITKALQAYKTIGGGKLDGLAFLGDMVQYGYNEYHSADGVTINGTTYPQGTVPGVHYDDLLAAVNAEAADLPKVWTMGNHEFVQSSTVTDEGNAAFIDMFETKVGQPLDYHTTIGGYDFIAGGCEQFLPGKTSEDWIMQEVNNAIGKDSTNATVDEKGNYSFADGIVPDSTKPVFLTVHHSLGGTINGSSSSYTDSWMSNELYSFLQNRPQVIWLSGHNHVAPYMPRTIHQDGFTTYQASTMDNGGTGFTGSGVHSDLAGNGLHYGTVLEVEDNVVKLYRLDLKAEDYVGEPWVIDVPAIVSDRTDADTSNDLNHYYYSADKRTADVLVAPTMPEDINFSVYKYGTTTTFNFDNCGTSEGTPYQNDDYVAYYKVKVYDGTDAEVKTSKYYNRYADVIVNKSCSTIFTDLTAGETYTVKVYPYSIFDVEGEPYVTTITIPETDTVMTLKRGKTARIEAEHYAVVKRDVSSTTSYHLPTVVSDEACSNSGYIKYTAQRTGQTASWNFKVNVPAQDSYTINMRVQRNASWCGDLTYLLDGESIGTRGTTSTAYWLTETFTKTLAAGEHTISVSSYMGNVNANIFLDYIELIPTKTSEVKLDTNATIEFEDYPDYVILEESKTAPLSLKTLEDAEVYSNGKAISVTEEAENVDVSLPLIVSGTGKFSVEYKASKGAVLYITDAADEVVKTIDTSSYEGEDAIATVTENVVLEAGDYTVSAKVLATDGVATGILDSIKFTKAAYYNPVTYDKPVILEAEDFKTLKKTDSAGTTTTVTLSNSNVVTSALTGATTTHSGSGWVKYNAGKNNTVWSEIEIDVKTAGKYVIEYHVRNSGTYSSTNHIMLDGTAYASGGSNDAWEGFRKCYLSTTFTEGTHTVGFKAVGNSVNCYYAYDYIKITPAKANVSATEKTVIQGEDMHTVSGTTTKMGVLASNAACDDSRYFNYNQSQNVGVATTTATLNVEKTDYYDITAHLLWQVHYTGYTLKIDSTTVGTLPRATSGTDGWKTISKRVKLTEGTHTLTLTSEGNYGHQDSYIDYISFEPYDPTVTIPAEGKLIEAESNPYVTTYLKTETTVTNEDGSTSTNVTETETYKAVTPTSDSAASGSSKISINGGKQDTTTVKYTMVNTWNQPVNVEKAAKYVITYKVNQSANYHGTISVKLDGKKLDDAPSVSKETPVLTQMSYLKDLTKGAHTISVSASEDWNHNCTLVVDYVNIVPLDSAFEAADVNEPKTTIELENYVNNAFSAHNGISTAVGGHTWKGTAEGLSADNALYISRQSTSASANIDIYVPVDVKVAGTYNLSFSATGKETNHSDGIKLYIDGVVKTTTNHAGYTTYKTYNLSNVALTEGQHMLRFEVTRSGVNAHGRIDYISFSPVESAVYDDEALATTVTANIETAGEVIIALYDADGKLAGIHTETADAPKTLRNIEVACGKVPVSCTVYVWEDLVNVKPLTAPKAITVN